MTRVCASSECCVDITNTHKLRKFCSTTCKSREHFLRTYNHHKVKLSSAELRERKNARQREYAERNRLRVRAANTLYAKTNKSKRWEIEQRRRARKRQNTAVKFTSKGLQERLAYFGNVCWICKSAPGTQIDHVKPLSKGGPHMLSNLRPACATCNSHKHNIWPYTVGVTNG